MRKVLLLLLAIVPELATATTPNEREVVAATLILEAGGEYATGAMEAVMEVVRNRASKRKLSLRAVCLQKWQFSCWNGADVAAGIAKAKRHPRWDVAMAIITAPATNFTDGADHYHTLRVEPYWAQHLEATVIIGNHIFYK